MDIEYIKITYTNGSKFEVESGITSVDTAERRIAVLKARGMKGITFTTYVEKGRSVPAVQR